MNLKKLPKHPKNPQEFIRMMFKKAKYHPEIKQKNDYLRIDKELMDKALIECYYGYFWISKDKKIISKNFI